jgi:hypothetical protein
LSKSAEAGGHAARPVRVSGLEVNEVADGLVVYQADGERVHYLNNTAAVVFELCTGENTEGEIAALLGGAFELAKVPNGEVRRCLDHLRDQGVIR